MPSESNATEESLTPSVTGSGGRGIRPRTLLATAMVWLAVVTGGLAWMVRYENTPGITHRVPPDFPAGSTLARQPGQLSLIMFVHPRCPCSRASISELEKLMTKCHDRLAAQVVCYKPEGTSDEWAQTELWRRAAAIPGVVVHVDEGGRKASEFGAATSGQVALFDARGQLIFQGGITSARGHAGDNAGSDAVLAVVRGATERPATRVYGCPIQDQCDFQPSVKEPRP